MTVFEQRRRALLANVDCDGYMVVDLARLMPKEIDHTSLFYLTGYTGEGVLITTENETVLLADERYFEAAKDQVGHELVVREATGDGGCQYEQEQDPTQRRPGPVPVWLLHPFGSARTNLIPY